MDFVDFKIAKKLKEKGFREKVNAYYGKHENIFEVHPSLDMNDNDYRCSAPTISQVLKWFRDIKTISIEPCATPHNCWYYMIKCKGEIKATYMNNKYKTYEQAAVAGIEYVLDNLI